MHARMHAYLLTTHNNQTSMHVEHEDNEKLKKVKNEEKEVEILLSLFTLPGLV